MDGRPDIRFDPIEPQIAPSSVCHEIFVRAYAEPRIHRHEGAPSVWESRTRPKSWFSGEFIAIDTETVNHKLTFGAYERYRNRKLVERAVFYADSLPRAHPKAFAQLRGICRELDVRLYSLASVFSSHIWRMRKKGGTFVFFNACYDLSRLASSWAPATANQRRGARFINGFDFKCRFTTVKGPDGRPLVGKNGELQPREVEATFVRIRRDDRHHVRYDMARAKVLDLATLAHTLTDRIYSLAKACEAFGVDFADRPGEHDGTIIRDNVAGCLYDVAKTSELLFAVGDEYDRHPIDLAPWRAQSGASVAKAYLRGFGVAPRSVVQSDFSKEHQGYAAQAYFGGRVECDVVATPMPGVYIDAVSMYPTVFTLLNLWFDQVIPERLEPEELDPGEVQALLDEIHANPRCLLDRAFWPRLAFFALVDPNGATLPTRPSIPSPYLARTQPIAQRSRDEQTTSHDRPDTGDPSAHRLVTIGPVHSPQPLWYAGPDLAAAVVSGSGRPRIVRAWRLRPEGLQGALQPVPFRGDQHDVINPCTTNPFQRLIELRKRKSGNRLDDELRSTGYKIIANSGAYGCMVETTPEDIDPDAPRRETLVDVWGSTAFTARVDRPERHSPLCSFPIASLVTAGARLLLAVAERLIRDAGGALAYCDTDGAIVVASQEGGYVPCEHAPHVLPDGRRAVRALTWGELDLVLDDLAALNVYDRSIIAGSSFKLEDQNFDAAKKRQQLWFYGTREKSYALYTLDANGLPVLQKLSAHTIGQYRSPYPHDRERRWIAEAWRYTICAAIGQPCEEPDWFDLPATSQLTLSTANLMQHYEKTSGPFDFLAVAQAAFPRMLRCCATPRPACMLFTDPAQWATQSWKCLSCGTLIEPFLADTEQPAFRTYRRVVANLSRSIELKRLAADGSEPRPLVRGLTIPRPVEVTKIANIGKEVLVDPTSTDEELTAEELNATAVLVYRSVEEELDALRAEVRRFGIKAVARAAKVSLTAAKAFANDRTASHPATIAKIKGSLAKPQR